MSSTYTRTAGRPGLLDLTTTFPDGPGPLRTAAIYRIDGDVLCYCVAAPGRPRPADLTTERGDGRTLVVLKRAAPGAGTVSVPFSSLNAR